MKSAATTLMRVRQRRHVWHWCIFEEESWRSNKEENLWRCGRGRMDQSRGGIYLVVPRPPGSPCARERLLQVDEITAMGGR